MRMQITTRLFAQMHAILSHPIKSTQAIDLPLLLKIAPSCPQLTKRVSRPRASARSLLHARLQWSDHTHTHAPARNRLQSFRLTLNSTSLVDAVESVTLVTFPPLN